MPIIRVHHDEFTAVWLKFHREELRQARSHSSKGNVNTFNPTATQSSLTSAVRTWTCSPACCRVGSSTSTHSNDPHPALCSWTGIKVLPHHQDDECCVSFLLS